MKGIIGRSRPFLGDGPRRFTPFQFHEEATSLPSGHTTAAFAISSVLSERIKNPYATVGLYSLATLTAVARVYEDEHWFSDTVFAAAIGTVLGEAVVNLHEDNDSSSLHLFPTQNGVRAELRF
jgi:membrane-associated phospholipid phosphatase